MPSSQSAYGFTMCQVGYRQRYDLRLGDHSFHPKVSKEMQKRQEDIPLKIRDIALKAQFRLTHRYKTLLQRKSNKNVVVVVLARELSAFMWAILKELDIPANT